jgi:hypothetical protein
VGALNRRLHRMAAGVRGAGRWALGLWDLRDVHVYGGGGMVAWGISHWSPPASLIWIGVFMVYLGLALGRRRT